MSYVGKETLRNEIAKIIKDVDLSKITPRRVRGLLQEILDVDLTDRKIEINQIIMEILNGEDSQSDYVVFINVGLKREIECLKKEFEGLKKEFEGLKKEFQVMARQNKNTKDGRRMDKSDDKSSSSRKRKH